MRYGTFLNRVVASLIDSLLLFPAGYLLTFLFANQHALEIAYMCISHFYMLIAHALYGRTFGKKIMRVKLVRAHRHLPMGWSHAIRRQLLWLVPHGIFLFTQRESMPMFVIIIFIAIWLADILLAAIHPQNRSLRDFIAKTVPVTME